MKIAKFVLPVIAAGFAASSALGSITVTPGAVTSVGGVDVVPNSIDWLSDADWTSAAIVVDLTSGSVVNKQWPNPSNGGALEDQDVVSAFAGFVDAEMKSETFVGPGDASIAGGAGDLGGGPLNFSAPVSISWFNTATGNLDLQIANIALSTDAAGTWKIQSAGVVYSGVVEGGAMVPEPASLALLGLGGLAALRRR